MPVSNVRIVSAIPVGRMRLLITQMLTYLNDKRQLSSHADNTTLEITTISAPEHIGYDPLHDFFPIYNVAMNITLNPTTLAAITSVVSQVASGNLYEVQGLLRQFIAVPVVLYNDPVSLGLYPHENQNITGYL